MERLLSPVRIGRVWGHSAALCKATSAKHTESNEGSECGSCLKVMILFGRHFVPQEALFFADIETHKAGVYFTNRTVADQGCAASNVSLTLAAHS